MIVVVHVVVVVVVVFVVVVVVGRVSQQPPPGRGVQKRENPAMRDEHGRAHCYGDTQLYVVGIIFLLVGLIRLLLGLEYFH